MQKEIYSAPKKRKAQGNMSFIKSGNKEEFAISCQESK